MFRIIIRSITNNMNYLCKLPILATALSNKSNILTINNEQLMLKNFYSVKKSKGSKVTKPKVELRKEEIEAVINYNELLKNMKDAVEYLKQDYTNNLNLRVSPSSFEQLAVKTPSGQVKLGEIAQVEVKSAQMYLIDLIKTPDYVKPVLDAITKSKLHPNPQLDKTSIYLSIGRITREHREQMTKTAKLKCEQAVKKIKDAESKALRRAKEAKNVSSDLIFNVSQHIKHLNDKYANEANLVKDAKTKEILQSSE